ncbi:WbqC family protein [Ideonella sp. DXS29W]|uniref:WbqC family protein n=1 Tax=Ideonella lacteola TaxID=2984193 RepID=A0ABU9BXE0_9BURK
MTRVERAADSPTSTGGASATPPDGVACRRVAVLQPYLFPYLGTFQLARQVDRFVFFDDVAFIKKGYIHRNAVLLDGQLHPFTAPVRNASQNRTILQHEYVGDWQALLALLHRAYGKAPCFEPVYDVVQRVLLERDENVARKNARCMAAVFEYLGLPFEHGFSSAHALPPELRASARVRAVCRAEGATTYVNPAGGRALYDAADFERDGMALRFCVMRPVLYPQQAPNFVPFLSMLDVLMHCPREQVVQLLDACDLVQ